MGAQDQTEQALRDIHVLLAQSESYIGTEKYIIVDKERMLSLLQDLSAGVYGILDEYDLTQQGRDRAERKAKKRGEEIIRDTTQKAEDIYASSVLYTDEALHHVQQILQNASDSVRDILDKADRELREQKDAVHRDQAELKTHLEELQDTDKYLKLIDERNKELARELERKKTRGEKSEEEEEPSPYAAVKPEIKINAEYFERNGIPLEEGVAVADAGTAKEDADALEASDTAREDADALEISGAVNGDADTLKTGSAVNDDADALTISNAANDGMAALKRSADGEAGAKLESSTAKETSTDQEADALADALVADFIKNEREQTSNSEEILDFDDDDVLQAVIPEITVNLDAEYFKWRAASGQATDAKKGAAASEKDKEPKEARHTLFGHKVQ